MRYEKNFALHRSCFCFSQLEQLLQDGIPQSAGRLRLFFSVRLLASKRNHSLTER